jgi:hypothetical protein
VVDIDSEVRREPVEIPIEVRASVSGRRMRGHPIEAEQTTTVTAPARLARVTAAGQRPHSHALGLRVATIRMS